MPDMNWYIVQDMVDQLTEIKNQLKILNDTLKKMSNGVIIDR